MISLPDGLCEQKKKKKKDRGVQIPPILTELLQGLRKSSYNWFWFDSSIGRTY